MKTASSKAKGRPRKCRRCAKDYELLFYGQKVCEVCRQKCSGCEKILTEENQDSRSKKLGKSFRCKECVAREVRNSTGRQAWQKNYDLRRHYGLTLEEFHHMAKDGCEICRSNEKLVVDHDHDTGKVRGVLCSRCNTGLGMFKDSREFLFNAYWYLGGGDENC